MDSLIFALNAVLPIVFTVAVGYLLKRAGLVDGNFIKAANKLVFRVFLPAMLFLNVYKISDPGSMDLGYVLYAMCALLVLFFVAMLLSGIVTKKAERRGVFVQAAFRSNFALVGIPLAEALFGEEGAAVATLLSAVLVPALNVLAVISLSVFKKGADKPSVKKIVKDIIKNPLIQSIAAGIAALAIRALFQRVGIGFRLSDIVPVYKTLTYLSSVATPLALVMLGAQFEFSAIASLRREIIFGTAMRIVFAPVFGIGVAYLAFADSFSGAHFATFVAMFATPVAVSSVPMTQEMGGDTALAGQLVVWTTLLSAFSVFAASFLLKLGGIFG